MGENKVGIGWEGVMREMEGVMREMRENKVGI